jgi:hypothetical protein
LYQVAQRCLLQAANELSKLSNPAIDPRSRTVGHLMLLQRRLDVNKSVGVGFAMFVGSSVCRLICALQQWRRDFADLAKQLQQSIAGGWRGFIDRPPEPNVASFHQGCEVRQRTVEECAIGMCDEY